MVLVHKFRADWGDKKSICNKFQQTSPVVSIVWPAQHQNELLFGLTDGKVKAGQLRTNRAGTVYSHGGGSAVVSIVCSPDGSTCIAGHLDGSIYRFL